MPAQPRHARPKVAALDPKRPDKGLLAEAALVLAGGGLVAFPTETVYGLGARALDERALDRAYEAKGRPRHHPLIAHVVSEQHARSLAASWPPLASRLAAAFWPGPLTIVVDRADHVPPAISGGADSIAVRAPAHPIALALIEALGEPIAAPSANRYQGLSPTRASHVVKEPGDAVDLVLDAGPCEAGIESTVVDVRGDSACVLRPGAAGLDALRRVDPHIAVVRTHAAPGASRPSPGMESRHYAPKARLLLARTAADALALALRMADEGRRAALVLREGHPLVPPVADDRIRLRSLPADPEGYGRTMYAALHELDEEGVDAIVVESVPSLESWWAVADRLARGSAR
jgi:L-threonylcarbamoyladenylate synthase